MHNNRVQQRYIKRIDEGGFGAAFVSYIEKCLLLC